MDIYEPTPLLQYVPQNLDFNLLLTSLEILTLGDHLPTLRGQMWTFDYPPTHLILSMWFLNDLSGQKMPLGPQQKQKST